LAGALLLGLACAVATYLCWALAKTPRPAGELLGHRKVVVSLAFLAGDELLVSRGLEDTIRVWDVPTRTCRQVIPTGGAGRRVAASRRQPWFISTEGNEGLQWDATGTTPTVRYAGPGEKIRCVAVSPSGEYLAAAADDCAVYVWRAGHEGPVLRLGPEAGEGFFQALAFVGDNLLACHSHDAEVALVDVGARRVLARLAVQEGHGDTVACVDDSTIVTGGETRRGPHRVDGEVQVWSVPGRECERAVVLPSCAGVRSLAVAPRHGVVFAGCGDGTLVVCDLATLRVLRTVPAHDGQVYALAVSSDERLLASGGGGRTGEPGIIRLWDVDQLAAGAGPR
jgi:WD40 repeat protein